MLLKNFFAKINFEKIFRVQNTEIFENFFIKQQNSDVNFVGVLLCHKLMAMSMNMSQNIINHISLKNYLHYPLKVI